VGCTEGCNPSDGGTLGVSPSPYYFPFLRKGIKGMVDRLMKVTDRCLQNNGGFNFICDFSPPRGPDFTTIDRAKSLDVDFICVAYNPGKAVRVDTVALAYLIKQQANRDVIFNIACRDMNKLAIQSHLLGAAMLGLENIVVVMGDAFTAEQLEKVKDVSDYKTTDLIADIRNLNKGIDYKGSQLRQPANLCIGSTIDLAHGMEREALLAYKKVASGVDFFLTQSLFEIKNLVSFMEIYRQVNGERLEKPVFCGLQILEKGTVLFGNPPQWMLDSMEKGRSGIDIGLELLQSFGEAGFNNIYLVPPILKGGARNYESAQKLLTASRSRPVKIKRPV